MRETISARIYFAPDEPGRLYMKRAYQYNIPGVSDWCPFEVKGNERVALWNALDRIGAKKYSASGFHESYYKMQLNSRY